MKHQPKAHGTPAGELALGLPALTAREREALGHILNANGAKAAARDMGVAVGTSEKLRSRVFSKLNVANAEEAILKIAHTSLADGQPSFLSAQEASTVLEFNRDPDALTERERFLVDLVFRLFLPLKQLDIPTLPELTERENEILRHLVHGKSNRLVAETLGISPRTVENHRSNILGKLGARNGADLARQMAERVTGAKPGQLALEYLEPLNKKRND